MFEIFEEAWDYLTEGLEYFISFDWFGDLGEVFSGMFDGLSEVSILGIVFGLLCAGYNYYFRNYMIYPFTQGQSPMMQGITFIGALIAGFIGGYLVGNYFEKS